MNGMLLLKCENQWHHMLIPIPNSTNWNTQHSRLKSRVVTGLKVLANKNGYGKQTFFKTIVNKVWKSKLRIHFSMPKSISKQKGRLKQSIRAECNSLDPFFNKQHFGTLFHMPFNYFACFSQLFFFFFFSIFHEFFFFLFSFFSLLCRASFKTLAHPYIINPSPTLVSRIHWSKGIHLCVMLYYVLRTRVWMVLI